jgi:hypothetical protein
VDVAWFDGQKLQKLWGVYRSMGDDMAAAEVLALLKGWKPSGPAAPQKVLREVAKGDTGAVIVLVSTAKAPTREWNCKFTVARDTIQAKTYQECSDAYYKFWNEYNASWTTVGMELAGAGQTLFGWWNDGYVYYASQATGGFSFGSVIYPWSYWRWRGDSIVAPGLYGPNRFGYREQPQNLKLEIDGIETDSLGYLFQPSYNYWYWGRGILMLDGLAPATTTRVLARTLATDEFTGTYDDSLPLVYAARYAKGGRGDPEGDRHLGRIAVRRRTADRRAGALGHRMGNPRLGRRIRQHGPAVDLVGHGQAGRSPRLGQGLPDRHARDILPGSRAGHDTARQHGRDHLGHLRRGGEHDEDVDLGGYGLFE